MSQPQEQRFENLEQRVGTLEHAFGEIIKNEQMIIRLSQRHRINTQELKAITERIEFDIEDSTGCLDKIEATMATKQDIADLKAITEHVKLDIGDSRERFDKIETTMATKEDVSGLKEDISGLKATLFEILDRLPPKQ